MTLRTARPIGALALLLAVAFVPRVAEAAPTRVVVLGPNDLPIVKRLERNLTSMHFEVLTGTVTLCSRDVVTRLFKELGADSALCADNDAVGVWTKEGDHIALKEVVVARGTDDRSQELDAARAAMALRGMPKDGRKDPPGFTIVANGTAAAEGSGATSSSSPITTMTPETPGKDAPPPAPSAPAPPLTRYAPKAVLSLGPGVMASRDGGSFALGGGIEIGVSRYVALALWAMSVPATRTAERPEGSASYRPTLFGFGFGIPILPATSTVVPRIGCGYSMLWMHVTPESARAPNVKSGDSEDLLAPVMYVNAAASVKVSGNLRIVGEGMFGTSSHDLVVRIARQPTAHWGVPIASLALRAEWVVQ